MGQLTIALLSTPASTFETSRQTVRVRSAPGMAACWRPLE